MEDLYSNSCLMYEVQKIRNKKLIKQLISHEEIIEGFTAPEKLDKYIDNLGKHHICYFMLYKNEVAGIAISLKLEDGLGEKNTYVVDLGFYKDYRGKVALKLSRLALEKFLKGYKCEKLFAIIDKTNKASLFHAKWLNFEIVSTNEFKYFLRYKNHG